MIADLHAHYPMHVVTDVEPRDTVHRMTRVRGRRRLGDRFRALVLKVASIIGSDRDWWSGYRVTAERLREGDVRVVFSVLYRPFEEIDLGLPYGAPPKPAYFGALVNDLELVEAEVAEQDGLRVVRDRAGLDAALAAGDAALVHCVEGGFHLGATPEEVERNVAALARDGVAYVTLAHLFFRGVATNAPALPFLPDVLYRRLFPQRAGEGLTELGRAAVRAMVRERVLVDVSHMRDDALAETFALLDELDPSFPVISSHAGYRFGSQAYMHSDEDVRRIAARGGVIGLILAQHQLNDGVRRRRTSKLDESFEVIARHIDRIHQLTGSHDHVAIGSDFDGFIKPTMGGLEHMGDLAALEARLRDRYGDAAERIASGNVLRVLRRLWT